MHKIVAITRVSDIHSAYGRLCLIRLESSRPPSLKSRDISTAARGWRASIKVGCLSYSFYSYEKEQICPLEIEYNENFLGFVAIEMDVPMSAPSCVFQSYVMHLPEHIGLPSTLGISCEYQ